MYLLDRPPGLVDEYTIPTKTCDNLVVINGRCDYVLRYGDIPGEEDLDSNLVAIEVKKRFSLSTDFAQLIAYLSWCSCLFRLLLTYPCS